MVKRARSLPVVWPSRTRACWAQCDLVAETCIRIRWWAEFYLGRAVLDPSRLAPIPLI